MIDDKTKQKLLKELEKTGNVYLACLKVGIDRSTHYRWLDSDKTFKKQASQAIRRGKENSCDIAKHALMLKVKDKDMRAIEYLLSHNDPAYRRKQNNNITILHKKIVPTPTPVLQEKSLEEILDEEALQNHEKGLELHRHFTMLGGVIPTKPDGSSIDIDELPEYEAYIRDWQAHKYEEEEKGKA